MLAARRKALGLSQKELAIRLNLSQNRLSELELAPERLTVERLLVAEPASPGDARAGTDIRYLQIGKVRRATKVRPG
jgi:transcriptional regulator with XRE-family HTH domain